MIQDNNNIIIRQRKNSITPSDIVKNLEQEQFPEITRTETQSTRACAKTAWVVLPLDMSLTNRQVEIACVNNEWEIVKYETAEGYQKKRKVTSEKYPVTLNYESEDTLKILNNSVIAIKIQVQEKGYNNVYLTPATSEAFDIESAQTQNSTQQISLKESEEMDELLQNYALERHTCCEDCCDIFKFVASLYVIILYIFFYFYTPEPRLLS